MYKCNFCDKEFRKKNATSYHQLYCKSNPNKRIKIKSPFAGAQKGNIAWNKGLTKETDFRVKKYSDTLKSNSKYCLQNRCSPGQASSIEKEKIRRNKISIAAKKRGLGGYIKGSGRGKKGWYQEIFCDSSWELAFVIWCKDNNLDIKRNIQKFEYIFNNKKYNFIPDFIVENEYFEIKGYRTEQWKVKLEQFPLILHVLYELDMEPILDYVKSKYGKDYIKLYQ